MNESSNDYAIVIYRSPLSLGFWNIIFAILYWFGTFLMTVTIIALFFQGNQMSPFSVLLFPLGLAIRKTGSFYKRHIRLSIDKEELDPKEKSNYIYWLYEVYAEQLFFGGLVLALSFITLLGKVMRDADGANTPVEWDILLAVVFLLIASHKLKSFSEHMLREKLGAPVLALTWPQDADERVPLPSTPEKEPVPFRF